MADQDRTGYKIWAVDNVVYGPVELPLLVSWVSEERVTADTWVYSEQQDTWAKASQCPELKMFFQEEAAADLPPTPGTAALAKVMPNFKPGVLRRVKIFANMSDAELARFVEYMELKSVRQFSEVVRQGEPGDSMYMVLEGEVRVRLMINDRETILATLLAGEFFGEISLFDHGPRSADVVANTPVSLLKVSAASFHKLAADAPELATPFLLAMGRTLTGRIRADNKRYRDSVNFARTAGR